MKPAFLKSSRDNPFARFINRTFLFAFFLVGLVAFVAGFIHSGIAIVSFPLLAWSPFLLIISLHIAFAARNVSDMLYGATCALGSIALAVMAVRWLWIP